MTILQAASRGRFFQTAGAILTGYNRRTPNPVRRQSHLVGSCEQGFWSRCSRAEVQQILLAARRYELAGRQRGQRNGPLGAIALEVLALMANLVRYKSGQLEPSLAYLMTTLKRSKDAIVRALAALRAHGFLDWLRRFTPVEGEGKGPQIRQTSNAYRLSLPAAAAVLLTHWLGSPAIPDDLLTAELDRKTKYKDQISSLSCTEFVGLVTGAPAPSPEQDAFHRALMRSAQNHQQMRESA
ncbi:helix-turn-helix domain-containing protein [Paracoccus sp. (in: a-proteobacteria)]|uniref:helix-turn-helix domain-containing protein n=1 Tax=Paracoccus sp. TaxID=267 RepID=UPI0028A05074|nr:helix-turn-helix domain-containing protein [Paracoccus sp. (in: a-proteobacteria)]